MRYYPVFLDVAGKPVIVVGGGEIALRKVEGLVDAGAKVTVVSPDLHSGLQPLVGSATVRHVARDYESGDLEGYVLAFVATDDGAVNSAVAREARQRGIWVNAADDVPNCDFIMGGIVNRGDLTVSVSTGGTSPAMARKLREDIEIFLDDRYVLMADLAGEVRQDLRERNLIVDPDVWNAALDSELKELLGNGKRDEARQRLMKMLLEPAPGS